LQKYDTTYNKNTTNLIDRQTLFRFKDKHLKNSGKATMIRAWMHLKTQKANTEPLPKPWLERALGDF
jgi:hypothetical protein